MIGPNPGIGEDGKHLWFVLPDPDPVTKKVVIVMLVTARRPTDKTLVLNPGVCIRSSGMSRTWHMEALISFPYRVCSHASHRVQQR